MLDMGDPIMSTLDWVPREPVPGDLLAGRDRRGFTLLELLVAISLLTLGALVLVPALARTSGASPTVRCLNNLRQLQHACAMYAADNSGWLVPNSGGFAFNSSRWAAGWLDWGYATPNTNWQYLSGAALGSYTVNDLRIYKCPADRIPALNGQRVRSYSMNGFVGGTVELDSYGYATYRTFLREADYTAPGPARTFVLDDEHPDSINDEVLGIRMTPSTLWPAAVAWDDVPASHHSGAGAFSFADGHGEIHKWADAITMAPVLKNSICSAYGKTSVNDNRWLSAHATAPR